MPRNPRIELTADWRPPEGMPPDDVANSDARIQKFKDILANPMGRAAMIKELHQNYDWATICIDHCWQHGSGTTLETVKRCDGRKSKKRHAASVDVEPVGHDPAFYMDRMATATQAKAMIRFAIEFLNHEEDRRRFVDVWRAIFDAEAAVLQIQDLGIE